MASPVVFAQDVGFCIGDFCIGNQDGDGEGVVVSRPGRRGGRWVMETAGGRRLDSFGRGPDAREDCKRALRRRQCRQGRNPHAVCVAYRRGNRLNRTEIGPFCRNGNRGRWVMETRRGRELQSFGRGARAKDACKRALRKRQCRQGRNPHAVCVPYRNGRRINRSEIGPFCR